MSFDAFESRPLQWFFTIVALVLVFHAVLPAQPPKYDAKAQAADNCTGTPIMVPYVFNGNTVEPWSCKVQCTDQKQHYLVYENNVATECEILPGCNDAGEDHGTTCRIPSGVTYVGPMSGSGSAHS